MDLFGLGSMFGAIGDAVIGGLNYGEQKNQNKIDNAYREKAFEYQKQLQQQIFEREDNAVQRRVKDLEKAGFNKLMASGQSANAGQSVGAYSGAGGQAPQMQLGIQQSIDSIYNALKGSQEIATSKAQRALINAQIASEVSKAANITEDTKLKEQEYIDKVYNYKKYKGLNLPIGFQANSPYSAAQGTLFMAEKSAQEVLEAEKKAEKIEKEAHETWRKEEEKKKVRGKDTSKYINDPFMPSYLGY